MTGDVIKRKRKEKGLTQEELGKLTGVNKGAISKWEAGRVQNIKRSKLLQLAKILDVSPNELLDDYEEKKKVLRIPVLGRIPAGVPIEEIEDVIGYEDISEKLAESGEYFALKVQGDSMEPRIHDGDVLIVRCQCEANSGDVVIASIDGENGTCKRLKKTEDGLMLLSYNPEYDPFVFSKKEVEEKPVKIIGKVIEARSKF